jgi:superfamily II DNA or RNA helicase
MLTLRDYQTDIFNKSTKAFLESAKGICCVLPCRSGKSYIMARMIQGAKGNVLVLAHRHTLISQHKELLDGLGVLTDKVRVESVFTEASRLGRYKPTDVDLIIIDEAHLSEAKSYKKVCEYYNCRRVLFTATPARLDGKPLTLADTLITGITANELIKMGAISEYDYYAPDLNIDTDKVDMVAGEYNNGQLSELMCQTAIYGDVLKYYRLLGENRQAIAYCTSVKHSEQAAEMFNESGISAISIDGGMSIKERNKRMDMFRNGKVQILCNCNLISEGVTLPNASVALLLRPTMSLPLFIQQACRVLTPVEGKKAVIIDYVNNVQRHGLPTDNHEWSLSETVKKRQQHNDDGTLSIRQCENCFRCFKTANKCPYCGYEYQIKGRELKAVKDVELKQIQAIEKGEQEKQKKKARMEVGQCRTIAELQEIARARGYKQAWVWQMARIKHIMR